MNNSIIINNIEREVVTKTISKSPVTSQNKTTNPVTKTTTMAANNMGTTINIITINPSAEGSTSTKTKTTPTTPNNIPTSLSTNQEKILNTIIRRKNKSIEATRSTTMTNPNSRNNTTETIKTKNMITRMKGSRGILISATKTEMSRKSANLMKIPICPSRLVSLLELQRTCKRNHPRRRLRTRTDLQQWRITTEPNKAITYKLRVFLINTFQAK